MFGVAPFKPASERPCFQDVRMQIAADIGDDEKRQPDRDESDQQQRDGPARFNAIHPNQKRFSPPRRRNIGTRAIAENARYIALFPGKMAWASNSTHAAGKTKPIPRRTAYEGGNPFCIARLRVSVC